MWGRAHEEGKREPQPHMSIQSQTKKLVPVETKEHADNHGGRGQYVSPMPYNHTMLCTTTNFGVPLPTYQKR